MVRNPEPDRLAKLDSEAVEARLDQTEGYQRGWPKRRKARGALQYMGLSKDALAQDPEYSKCMRTAQAYRKTRQREMFVNFGYVSAGVSALMGSCALALASSRYWYEKGAEAKELGAKAHYMKLGSQLADSARANELAAWELCARESTQKKRSEVAAAALPWLAVHEGTKKKPGPKSKLDDIILSGPTIERNAGSDSVLEVTGSAGGGLSTPVLAEQEQSSDNS